MKVFMCEQGSDEWHALRRGIPTASNFDRIITPLGKPSKQAEKYICELIGEKFSLYGPERPEAYTNNAIRHGQETEAEARRWYSMETNQDVLQVGFCMMDNGQAGCSPDGLVGDDGLVEMKCPKAATHVEYLLNGVLPVDYAPQCHGQLICTGRKWVDFVSYHAGLPPFMVRVTPDDYTELLRAALDAFALKYKAALAKVKGEIG